MHKPPFRGTINNGVVRRISDNGIISSLEPTYVETGSWSSVKTPGFKNLKPALRPNNPFSATLYQETRYIGRMADKFGGGIYGTINGQIPGTNYGLPVSNDTTMSSARSQILSKLQDSSVNLAQAFAERKQTVDLIARNVNRIASAAIAIRRGNLRHASNLFSSYGIKGNLRKEIIPSPKNLSNYWLEYSYGWRPLISDIYGSCELLAKSFYEKRPTLVSARSTQSFPYDKYEIFRSGTYSIQERFSGSELVETRYVVTFLEEDSFSARMSSTGITNPLLLAWELIPYSFVVDWAVPVGTYLQNLGATRGLTFRGGTTTRKKVLKGASAWNNFGNPANPVAISGAGRLFSREEKTRSVLSSFPAPILEINPHLGVNRALSGLALLIQSFKR